MHHGPQSGDHHARMAALDGRETVVGFRFDEHPRHSSPSTLMAGDDHAPVAASLQRSHRHEPRQRHASGPSTHREPTRWPHECALVAVDLPGEVSHVRGEAPVESTTETRVGFGHDRFADVPPESQAEPRVGARR